MGIKKQADFLSLFFDNGLEDLHQLTDVPQLQT